MTDFNICDTIPIITLYFGTLRKNIFLHHSMVVYQFLFYIFYKYIYYIAFICTPFWLHFLNSIPLPPFLVCTSLRTPYTIAKLINPSSASSNLIGAVHSINKLASDWSSFIPTMSLTSLVLVWSATESIAECDSNQFRISQSNGIQETKVLWFCPVPKGCSSFRITKICK